MENATQSGAEVQPSEPQDLVSLFAAEIDRKEPLEDAPDEVSAAEEPSAEPEVDANPEGDEEPLITVKVNGQELQVKQSELVANYQKDAAATQKFEEAAQLRKQADTETAKARQERQTYAEQLGKFSQQLEFLQAQTVDWQALIDNDPQEYLKQQHAFNQRQIQLNEVRAAQAHLAQQNQYEAQNQIIGFLRSEQESMLAKIPEMKDPAKAKQINQDVSKYLIETMGYSPREIFTQQDNNGNIVSPGADHRLVVMAHKAAQYDALIAKATVTSKKVAALPAKVERPGNGDANKPDGRTEAMKRLSRSGRVEDAAAAFAQFL